MDGFSRAFAVASGLSIVAIIATLTLIREAKPAEVVEPEFAPELEPVEAAA